MNLLLRCICAFAILSSFNTVFALEENLEKNTYQEAPSIKKDHVDNKDKELTPEVSNGNLSARPGGTCGYRRSGWSCSENCTCANDNPCINGLCK